MECRVVTRDTHTKATRFVGNAKSGKALNLFESANLLRVTWLNKNEEFKERQRWDHRIKAADGCEHQYFLQD